MVMCNCSNTHLLNCDTILDDVLNSIQLNKIVHVCVYHLESYTKQLKILLTLKSKIKNIN